MAMFIRLDLFPSRVTIDEVLHKGVRTIITDDQIIVYNDTASGPAPIFEAPYGDLTGDVRAGYTATTADGQAIFITKSGGCGCGSRLKGFRPFPGVQHLPR